MNSLKSWKIMTIKVDAGYKIQLRTDILLLEVY